MKDNLKKIYIYTSTVFTTIVSLLCVLLFSSFGANKMMRRCVRKHKSFDDCVVLGNGPSIKSLFDTDYSQLANKNIFVVNFFCLTDYFDLIKPNFYTLLDPNIFRGRLPNLDALVEKLNAISWEMVLFVPVSYKKSEFLTRLTNSKLIIIPFNSTPVSGLQTIENFLFKNNLGMPMPQTVINAVIFLAINLGHNVINLYGVEQSWLKHLSVDNNNKITVGLPHFYSGSDVTSENRSLCAFLLSQAATFKSHMRLQDYAQHNGQRILNHTPGSYIDAYERVSSESVQ